MIKDNELSLDYATKLVNHFKNLGFIAYEFGIDNIRFCCVHLDGIKNIHIGCKVMNSVLTYVLYSYSKSPAYGGYECVNEHEMLAKVLSWLYEGE